MFHVIKKTLDVRFNDMIYGFPLMRSPMTFIALALLGKAHSKTFSRENTRIKKAKIHLPHSIFHCKIAAFNTR